MRGVLIAFEGIEGSGKTTQAELLYQNLKEKSIPCIFSREPGGTEIGERIREILLDPKNQKMHAKTELLLYLANRCQHAYEKILPELQKGTVIITDRFSDSSLAYQGKGRDLSFKVVSRLNKFATFGIKPDLVILVDVPVEIGLTRTMQKTLDRLEQEEVKFHKAVRDGYRQLAKRAPKRIKLFDGMKEIEKLQEEINQVVLDFLKKKSIIL
ncbi:MAG: dTMP kinase [bacterium]|nr:dTMP kinase [candidate division WOR-3 bacterium]MDH5683665.1 dTMP kinase [candidate division WOR-3 bacterium]